MISYKSPRRVVVKSTFRLMFEKVLFIKKLILLFTPVFFYKRVHDRLRARLLALSVSTIILAILVSVGLSVIRPGNTSAAIDSTINFQARLQSSTGAIVPDGNYNIEFKIYNSSGTNLWIEDYLNSAGHGVQTINGYLTVNLGSITAFPSTIDWSQNLFLTMNIGGTTTGAPSWDGEMTPSLPITAVPYAFQAGSATQLQATSGSNTATLSFVTPTSSNNILLPNASGTVCLDNATSCGFALSSGNTNYIQNGTAVQSGNFNVQAATSGSVAAVLSANASGSADILDLQNGSGSVVGSVGSTGNVLFEPSTNSTNSFQINNNAGSSVVSVDTVNDAVGINGASTSVGYALNVNGSINALTQIYLNGAAVCTASSGCVPASGSGAYIQNSNASQNNANFDIQSANAAYVGGVIQGATGQTADLLDFSTSGGRVSEVTSSGEFQGANGSGSNASGTNLLLAGGESTGTGNGGNIALQIAQPGGSGSSLNALTTVATFSGVNGALTLQNAANSASALQVLNSSTSNVFQVSTSSQTDLQGGTDIGAVGINGASVAAGYAVDITGSLNATAVYDGGTRVCTAAGCAPVAGSSNYIQNTTTLQTASNFNIQSASASSVGGVIEDDTSQTADLLDFRNSSATNLVEFTSAGYLQGGNASGTNIAGTNLVVAGGEGTGTGSGGNLNFDIYKPSATSGSSLNSTAATVFSLSGTNGAATFKNSANSTTAFQVQNAAGSSVLNVDSFDSTVIVTQNVASYGTTGPELMTSNTNFSSGWSGTGWTFTSSSATHASGNTTAATYSGFTPIVGQTYQVTFTFSGANGVDNILPGLGGASGHNIYLASDTNETQNITAGSTGSLQFTPTTAWAGSITSVSIKLLGSYSPALEVVGATGGGGELDLRASAVSDVLIGFNAGIYLQSGTGNETAIGEDALGNDTTGGNNVAVGTAALAADTSGAGNDALGVLALGANTTGSNDLAIGGVYTLYSNTTGSGNVAIGSTALLNNTSGSDNTALGFNSGNQSVGTGSGNTYIGYYTGQTNTNVLQNSTAIGNDAEVGQSNALILGCINGVNSCTSATSVGIGTAYPGANLDVVGTGIFQSSSNSTTAFQIQNTAGAPILDVDTTSTAPNGSQLNYLTYPGFESGSFTNASAGWAGSSATLTQNALPSNAYNGLYSAKVVTTANPGGITTSSFVSAPPTGTYIISFYAEASSGSLSSNSFVVTSTDGATHTCSPASGTTIVTTGFQRLYCSLTTTGSMTALKITYAATSTTLFIDAVQLQSSTYNGTTLTIPTLYQIGGIQLRGAITNPVAIVSTSNSPTAFQVQNAAGSTIFSIDTFNTRITLGSASATPTLIVLGNKNTSGDPTEVDGAMYYNSSTGSFRCGQAGSWTNCIGGLISSNTSASTTLTGSSASAQNFSTTSTVPANYCVAGRVIDITANGIMSTTTTAQPISFALSLGSTQVGTASVSLTPSASLTARGWHMQFQIVCDAAPSSTSAVTGEGWLNIPGTSSTSADQTADLSYVATNIATNAAQLINIGATFGGTASASNTITLEQLIVNGE